MPLPAPKLDDRSFQDLVDEAKKRIPQYCKEWTDHNVSDPGVTMIELFAWMTDVLLYRLNQVPDLHYIRMMEMLGIQLGGPQPAHVPVTFWLSAPQNIPIIIPTGTEVSSTQTESERPVVFTTDREKKIIPAHLTVIASRITVENNQKKLRDHNLRRLEAGFEGVEVFSPVPQVNDALYLGFDTDLSDQILGFDVDFDPAGGAGIDPTLPPYIWEASTGEEANRWQPCNVDMDTTKGMNVAGRIRIHLPSMGKYDVADQRLYWVRARIIDLTPEARQKGAQPYRLSPRLRRITAGSWGCTIPATHAQSVHREVLGHSDGTPGQSYKLKFTPILARMSGETLAVQADGHSPIEWTEVGDFSDSVSGDLHYTLDSNTGELRLPPAIRQQDGTIKLFGSIPPRSSLLIFQHYRHGGGQEGNVQPGVINTLKTALPYIARVSNRFPATGGLDAETLESAKMRVPGFLRSRQRAVTEDDYEFIARQALPGAISRIKCLQPTSAEAGRVTPGQVYLLVIPRIPRPSRFLSPEDLNLSEENIRTLRKVLDERRLLTVRLDIRPPAYQWVSVKVKLRACPGADKKILEREVLNRLYQFLNPIVGGQSGTGWDFGRSLFASDIYQCLQGIADIQFVRSMEMFAARPGGGAQGPALETLDVAAHAVIASGQHVLEWI